MAARWYPLRCPHSGSVQCTVSRGGIRPSPVSHRTLTATERPVSVEPIRYSKMRMWSYTRNYHSRNLRMSHPAERSPVRYRGSKTQVEKPILYTRGVEPLGRSRNWATSRWTKAKVESGPPSGGDDSSPPLQDREVHYAGKDRRVRRG
jgi:hypothetical protein